jgi:signal transduction histidine kinase
VEQKTDEIDLKELLLDTVEEMKATLKKGQHFKIDCPDNCHANTDKKLFRNVLINLISNAIKFSDENKSIMIQVESSDDKIMFSITDQGIGISPEDQEHLFASFFRAANATNIQGTGLGLHIVKRYVDLLGGEIQLQSQLNKAQRLLLLFL